MMGTLYGDRRYGIAHAPSRRREGLGGAWRSEGKMTKRRTKIATLLSTSALVALDTTCPLHVIGGPGERGEARGREWHAAAEPGSWRPHDGVRQAHGERRSLL
jgi:hypothetical protein